MKLIRLNRVLALCLAVLLLVPLSALPAHAAFPDVSSARVGEAVALLEALGIVSGYPDGRFQPDRAVSRAEFCKMAVLTSAGADPSGYVSFTLFPDVGPKHWARGYVGAAVRALGIIRGYPDGAFRPDATINFGEAVTIAMRLLGYTDEDVGARWPDGYIDRAAGVGLTAGLSLKPGENMTRGNTAVLFYNLLHAKTKDGKAFLTLTGVTEIEDAVLLSAAAVGADGVTRGVLLHEDGFFPVRTTVDWPVGRRGDVMIDAAGYAVSFTPAAQTKKTLAVKSATSTGLVGTDGSTVKNIPAAAIVFVGDETDTWTKVYAELREGQTVTFYFNARGQVDYLFWDNDEITGRVVLKDDDRPLTAYGIPAGARVYRDGLTVAAADIRLWDVLTYNEATGTVHASSYHITAVYERALPGRDDPETLVALGGQGFTLLEQAQAELRAFAYGDLINLYFTADGQVAAVRAQSEVGDARMLGVMLEDDVVQLSNGVILEGAPIVKFLPVGSLVRACVKVTGTLSLAEVRLSAPPAGDVDLGKMTMGSTRISPTVTVIDKSDTDGGAVQIPSAMLPLIVPRSYVLGVELSAGGIIDTLVLKNATGCALTYGLVTGLTDESPMKDFDDTYTPATVRMLTPQGEVVFIRPNSVQPPGVGSYIAVVWQPGGVIKSYSAMTKMTGLRRGDFTTETVKIGNYTYSLALAGQVLAGGKAIPISEALAKYDRFDLWLDRPLAEGGVIRAVSAY